MAENRDPPSRFRPPRETSFVRELRQLLELSAAYDNDPTGLRAHQEKIRRHVAMYCTSDDDLDDFVRLSVQVYPEKYTESFEEIRAYLQCRRDQFRKEFGI